MVSQEIRDASFISSDSRTNFKTVIAKRSDLVTINRGRMVKPGSGDQIYNAGQILGQITAAGPTQYRWTAYNPAATDGSQVAKAILAEEADVDSLDNGSEILFITKGALYQDLLVGTLDAAALASLKATQYVEGGANIIEIGG